MSATWGKPDIWKTALVALEPNVLGYVDAVEAMHTNRVERSH